jgi:viroplasmin and RNaseH domain-containing protein
MAKNKFYAIKKGNGVENKIVLSWEECKSLVDGYPSIFKSFKSEDDALKYLGIEKSKSKKKPNKKNKSKANTNFESGIINLQVQNKSHKNKNFKVQISDELYNDFISKCMEKHLSKDMILAFIINQWTYDETSN